MHRLMVILLLASGFGGTHTWAQDRERENPMERFEDASDKYQELWRTGRYRESLEYLEKAINASAEVPLLWLYDRAQLYFEVGEVDRAINEIEWLHYRRPYPKSALQLALYYRARGDRESYQRILDQAANRYRRFRGGVDETDNALAMIKIKELMGENARSLFQDILSVEEREEENTIKRYLAAGGLAWRKFDFQLASEHYENVLELDPENLDAMVGLAECYWKSSDPRLGDALSAVLAINPVHPRALAIKVERHLENDRFEEAMALIEKVLDFNHNHLRFLGLKSAALFLMDEPERAEVVRQTALLFNPYAAEVFRITGRIASRKYRFAEAAEFQKRALELDPDDHLARAYYAFDLLRLGEDARGLEELRRSFEGDRFNVQVYNMLELMDKVVDFAVREEGGFRLQMPEREMEIWGDEAIALLTEALAKYEKKYRVRLERPISVQIFDDHDDFMVRSLGLPGMVGFLGICFGELITMDAPSARGKGEMSWKSTLWHEFVHVVTLQKTKNRMPRWLSEGISVYEETVRDPSWGQRLAPPYQTILSEDGMPGLEDLEPYLTQPKSAMHTMFGYFASGELVTYYVERYGFDALVEALDKIASGSRAEPALLAAADAEEKDFDKGFREHLSERVSLLANMEGPTRLNMFGKEPMVPAPDSPFMLAMKAANEAMSGGETGRAIEKLREADALFPEATGPETPRALLAQIYEERGEVEKLQAVLEKSMRMDATDYRACRMLVEVYRDTEQWQGLLDASANGIVIDPFDVWMRRAHVDALEKLGRGEAAAAELATLIELDPASAVDYRLQRLDLLMASGSWSLARNEAVRLLEEVPYSWQAQKRLLRIDEERGKP